MLTPVGDHLLSGVAQALVLRLLQLNVAIKHLDYGTECTFSKFGDDPQLEEAAGTLEDWDAVQRDQDSRELC